MADITPLIPVGRKIVQSYGGGGFRISGEDFTGSVIVLPEAVIPWPVTTLEDISFESLSAITGSASSVGVLLIGMGASMTFLDPDLRMALKAHGIVAESMDTGAACRTLNVLVSEDRAAAAALIAVE